MHAGGDARSPHERLHGEKCITPLVPFEAGIVYLHMICLRRDKGEVAKRRDIWLGVISRAQEMIIATDPGAVKCRIVTRFADDEGWERQTNFADEGHTVGICVGQSRSANICGNCQQREWSTSC